MKVKFHRVPWEGVTTGQAGASQAKVNNEPNIQRSAGDDLRARILDAARDLFRQFGFPKTSMQEIAEACGMSAANLYRFYEGKFAIGVAVASRDQAATLSSCDAAIQSASGDTADQLIMLFRAVIDETRRKMKKAPQLFELDMMMTREEPVLRHRFLEEIERRILSILAAGAPHRATPEIMKLRGKMILMASAPFLLPWMLLNEPFGDPRSMVEPLIRSLVADLNEVLLSKKGNPSSPPIPKVATVPTRRRAKAV